MNDPTPKPWFAWFIPPPALAVSFVVISLFGVAYWRNSENEMLIGALISAFTGAVGYWLGSSKGAQDNRDQLNKAQDRLLAVSTAPKPTAPAPSTVDEGELPPWERPL